MQDLKKLILNANISSVHKDFIFKKYDLISKEKKKKLHLLLDNSGLFEHSKLKIDVLVNNLKEKYGK